MPLIFLKSNLNWQLLLFKQSLFEMDFLKNFFPLCQFLYYSTPYSSVCALSSYKITVLPRYRPLLLGTYELDLKLLLDKYMCIAITITLSTRQLETDTTIVC